MYKKCLLIFLISFTFFSCSKKYKIQEESNTRTEEQNLVQDDGIALKETNKLEEVALNEEENPEDEKLTPPDDRIYIKFLHEGKYGLLDSKLNIIKKNDCNGIFLVNDYIFFADKNGLTVTDLNLYTKANIKTSADNIAGVSNLIDDYYDITFLGSAHYIYNMKTKEHQTIKGLASVHLDEPTSILQPLCHSGYYVSLLDGKQYFEDNGYEMVYQFTEGLAVVVLENGEKNLINEEGKTVLDGIVNCGFCFKNGLMPVITKTKSGYINNKCEFVIECDLADEGKESRINAAPTLKSMFLENYAYVHMSDNVWTIMKKDGTIVKDNIRYPTQQFGFSDGMIKVYNNGKAGFVNTEGDLVIPIILDSAEDFVNGYAIVVYDGEDAILDKQGNVYLSKDLLEGNKEPFTNVLAM